MVRPDPDEGVGDGSEVSTWPMATVFLPVTVLRMCILAPCASQNVEAVDSDFGVLAGWCAGACGCGRRFK
jgi:hypothetical protein